MKILKIFELETGYSQITKSCHSRLAYMLMRISIIDKITIDHILHYEILKS